MAGLSTYVFDQLPSSGGAIRSGPWAEMTLTHGLAGGTLSVLQGGKFDHGFVSATGSAALSPLVGAGRHRNYYTGLEVSTLIGGVD